MTKLGATAPGGGRYISLTGGYLAIVDEEDFARTRALKWQARANKNGYISVHRARTQNVAARTMGRFILGVNDERVVDHINGNTLDNRKSNLRACDRSANGFNRVAHGRSSRFKGVCLNGSRWFAQIRFKGGKAFLGRFESEEDAARAYDAAARKYHGEFASVNFPVVPSERCAIRSEVAS